MWSSACSVYSGFGSVRAWLIWAARASGASIQNWDDTLRLAGSLKLGRVPATGIMRTLQVGERATRLAQGIAECGRIDKTIHSLNFIDDESKRRRTLVQLNRGAGRHDLSRVVFHGQRGELRQRH